MSAYKNLRDSSCPWGALAWFLLFAAWPVSAAGTLEFPDGTDGLTPVIQRVSLSSPFTVPAGMNFYVLNISAMEPSCRNQFGIGHCYLSATGGTDLIPGGLMHRMFPAIVGPGAVVASTSSMITIDVQGFLVAATVTAVVADLAPSASYTVPAGMNFYLMNTGGTANAPYSLAVGGVTVASILYTAGPVIVGAGRTIRNTGSVTVTLDGYLKPQ